MHEHLARKNYTTRVPNHSTSIRKQEEMPEAKPSDQTEKSRKRVQSNKYLHETKQLDILMIHKRLYSLILSDHSANAMNAYVRLSVTVKTNLQRTQTSLHWRVSATARCASQACACIQYCPTIAERLIFQCRRSVGIVGCDMGESTERVINIQDTYMKNIKIRPTAVPASNAAESTS
jgi:hypothetical protein